MLSVFLSILENNTDRQRFSEVYDKYCNLMHYIAVKILEDTALAEDAVQEAFLNYAVNFDRLKAFDDEHTRNLLAVIAKNEALTILGKERNFILTDSAELQADLKSSLSGHDPVSETVDAEHLKNIILELPDTYRELVYLIAVCELSLKEAAGILHISYENAKKRLQRARKMIKEKMKG